MADEVTLGEIARNLDRLDKAQRQLATDSVPAKQYEVAHQALQQTLTDHITQSGIDRARIERAIDDLRRAHDRAIEALRTDLDKEVAQARAENREQIAALKRERESSGMNAWQRFGIASVAVIGLLSVFVAFYVGTHR